MSKDEQQRSIAYNPLFWGWSISAIFAIFYFLLAVARRCKFIGEEEVCSSNFVWFTQSAPNEIGDTLAGMAGVLAFLWIIVTVMLQSQELREQRKELRQSRNEYAKMSAALEVQAGVFRDEQRQRRELEAEKLLNALLGRFKTLMSEHSSVFYCTYSVAENLTSSGKYTFSFLNNMKYSQSAEGILGHLSKNVDAYTLRAEKKLDGAIEVENSVMGSSFFEIIDTLHVIEDLQSKLSAAEQVRLRGFQFRKIASFLNGLPMKKPSGKGRKTKMMYQADLRRFLTGV